MRFDGSLMERYLSEEAEVPTGRWHSAERGVWEVWVWEAEAPRSNWFFVTSL